MKTRYIVRIDSYQGDDTSIQCSKGGADCDEFYCVIVVGESGAEIVDNGYRSLEEAQAAWPEAVPRCAV